MLIKQQLTVSTETNNKHQPQLSHMHACSFWKRSRLLVKKKDWLLVETVSSHYLIVLKPRNPAEKKSISDHSKAEITM